MPPSKRSGLFTKFRKWVDRQGPPNDTERRAPGSSTQGDQLQSHQSEIELKVARLIADLVAPRYESRIAAAQGLGGIGAEANAAIPELLRCAVAPHGPLRKAALAALDGIAPAWHTTTEAIIAAPSLVQFLGSGTQADYGSVSYVLQRIGPPAVPALSAALGDSSDDVKQTRSATVLGSLGPVAVGAIPELARALSCDRKSVRLAAILAIAKLGDGAAVALPHLARCLKDPNPELRQEAARAISGMKASAGASTSGLIALLSDSVEEVRTAASQALLAIGAVTAPELTAELEARDRRRLEAFLSIHKRRANWNPAELLSEWHVLPEALVDGINWERTEAHDTYWRIEHSLQTLVSLLGSFGTLAAASTPALIRALSDSAPSLREAAALALAQIGPAARDSVPALVLALSDTASTVQKAALAAAEAIAPNWRTLDIIAPSLEELIARLRLEDRASTAASEALLWVGEHAVPHLALALVHSSQPQQRMRAANTLGKLGLAALGAVGSLNEAATRDLDDNVRRAASKAAADILARQR